MTADDLDARIAHFPTGLYHATTAKKRKVATAVARDAKQGSYVLDGRQVAIYDKGTLAPSGLTGKSLARAKLYVPLRDAYQGVLDAMGRNAPNVELAAAQAELRASYEAFTRSFGLFNILENAAIILRDPNGTRILSLEEIRTIKVKGKRPRRELAALASIFSERTVRKIDEPTTAATPKDALVYSLAWKGRVDLDYMQSLTGRPATTLTTELVGDVFFDLDQGAWVTADEYLSGDVVSKLAHAEAAAKTAPAAEASVAALQKVQPTQLAPEEFEAPFGATWVPLLVYEQFLREEANGREIKLPLTKPRIVATDSDALPAAPDTPNPERSPSDSFPPGQLPQLKPGSITESVRHLDGDEVDAFCLSGCFSTPLYVV